MNHDENSKTILHCAFTLVGQDFVLVDGQGEHKHTLPPAFSLEVNCETPAPANMNKILSLFIGSS